ncbi:hypothetical protein J3B02_000449 [Coemansia erecta]|uniref:Sodium/calcium exchanger membrane region domain-containing protein n=1 Tax=Coemansia asiatica TaxID=1052880 RepID=A0A9W7XPS0_9FUNG|nr:hypothetical protein LPJ64_001583 [Coemansia asiatica]KAJ2858171.1 hypothetical protein J3B02_000449 [Coemansia erecta]KAJ2887695.1 hypothetical protein FB639_001136 [Coemansia asiatica]
MPNIFNRLRGNSNTKFSLHSTTQAAAESAATSPSPVVPRTSTSASRSPSSKYWGPRAATYASNAARKSMDRRQSDHRDQSEQEAGLVAKEHKMKPAGLAQPWLIIRRSILSSWINVLLLLVPVGIASHPAKFPDVAIFLINFFAIIPLAKTLGYATEQLALHLGDALGGLLNATFGNAVELLVGILALVKGEIEIVQTSLVGSVLSNLLLVGGCCFFFGGLKNNEQVFSAHAAQSYGSLLAMAILATLLPAAYNSLNAKDTELKSGTLTLSHVTAIFLLVIYIAYLFFQLKTHSALFMTVSLEERIEAAKKPAKKSSRSAVSVDASAVGDTTTVPTPALAATPSLNGGGNSSVEIDAEQHQHQQVEFKEADADANAEASADAEIEEQSDQNEDEDEEEVELTAWAAALLLAVVTGLTGVCAEFLVDSIDGLTDKWNLSPSFVGMILLPIVGNAAEHVTAVTVAIRNKMDLALGVAVGSSIQIALFVMPFLCILGWIIKEPMTIYFSPFTTVVLFITVLLVNYIIGDGRTNWLEGLMLLMAYFIIGVAYFLYPKDVDTASTAL